MGKKYFRRIYRKIKQDNGGQISCKISYYSDDFDPNKNYSGIIVYGINGRTFWTNNDGQANGCRGRSFYVIILCTEYFPEQRDVGQGRVHYYPLEKILGYSVDKDKVLCGGFAYHEGQLKFSSIWLNQYDQMGLPGASGETDGDKYLSNSEEQLVRFVFNQYKRYGPNHVFQIPYRLDSRLS